MNDAKKLLLQCLDLIMDEHEFEVMGISLFMIHLLYFPGFHV